MKYVLIPIQICSTYRIKIIRGFAWNALAYNPSHHHYFIFAYFFSILLIFHKISSRFVAVAVLRAKQASACSAFFYCWTSPANAFFFFADFIHSPVHRRRTKTSSAQIEENNITKGSHLPSFSSTQIHSNTGEWWWIGRRWSKKENKTLDWQVEHFFSQLENTERKRERLGRENVIQTRYISVWQCWRWWQTLRGNVLYYSDYYYIDINILILKYRKENL